MNLGEFLHNVLSGLGNATHAATNDVQHVAQAAHLNQLFNAVNPFAAQTALSPESLRPGQAPRANNYMAPYNVNGQQQHVGWMPPFPAAHGATPMPTMLGIPDYTAVPNFNRQVPIIQPDQPSYGVYGPTTGFAPHAQTIQTQVAPQPLQRYSI